MNLIDILKNVRLRKEPWLVAFAIFLTLATGAAVKFAYLTPKEGLAFLVGAFSLPGLFGVAKKDDGGDEAPPDSGEVPTKREGPGPWKRVVLLVGALQLAGCGLLGIATKDVIAAVVDGIQILDAIEKFVSNYFLAHPDPAEQKKVAESLAKTRTALNVALRSAQGADKLDQAQLDAAFADFEAAYAELLGLVRPYGVRAVPLRSARFAQSEVGLQVPEPLALRRHQ